MVALQNGTTNATGYKYNFKNSKTSLFERLKCPICNYVLNYPKQSIECGHRFCSECITNYLRDNNPAICPVADCNTQLVNDKIFSDNGTKKEIDQLVVFCEFKDNGCPAELQLKHLYKHINEQCNYLIIDCLKKVSGCQERVKREDLEKHLQNDCLFRQIECNHCRLLVTYNDLENHFTVCPKFPVGCPNNCSNLHITRDFLDQHLSLCPKQKKKCSYFIWGCQFTGLSSEIEAHENDVELTAVHLNYVKVALAKTELSCVEAKRKIAELQNQKTITEAKFQKMDKDSLGFQNANMELENKLKSLHKTLASVNDKYLKLEKQIEQFDDKRKLEEVQVMLQSIQVRHRSLEEKVVRAERKGSSNGGGRDDRVGSIISPLEIEQLRTQFQQHDRQIGMHDIRLAEQDLRFQILETVSYDGVLIWKIKDYTRRKQEAVSGKILSLYSQPFYTSRYGYKMCARVYLNGDGMGKGSHMSLFFVVMRGEYDALLQWPFKQKVTLMLLDQETGRSRHMSDTFRPDPTSSSFRRPTSDMNIASGCPLFVSHPVLESPTYIKSDTLFIKIIVETSDLYGP